MKRYQECNKLQKLTRRRHYLLVPLKWLYYQRVPFLIYSDDTEEYSIAKGRVLWKLLIGEAQFKMNWYYTSEEVFEKYKLKAQSTKQR